jgi:hypothetical protein
MSATPKMFGAAEKVKDGAIAPIIGWSIAAGFAVGATTLFCVFPPAGIAAASYGITTSAVVGGVVSVVPATLSITSGIHFDHCKERKLPCTLYRLSTMDVHN